MNIVDWIIIFVGGTIQIAIILSYLSQDKDSQVAKFLSRITHPLKKVTNVCATCGCPAPGFTVGCMECDPNHTNLSIYARSDRYYNNLETSLKGPSTIEGPKGEFRVEPQDDGRWAVIQLHYDLGHHMSSSSFVDAHPTLAQAMCYARRYAGLPEFEPPAQPLPDRRAAIAHTKALS